MAYLQHAEAEAEEYYQEEDVEEEEEEEEEAEEAEEEEEESEDDLFGPSNEEYMGTPAFSPLPPPNLPPPLRPAGNHGARGNARGVWHAGRSGAYQSGQSFKGGNGPSKYQKGRWTDERFVAEMTLGFNEETLSHNCPPFQEPSEIACYSRTADGSVHYDDRSLRRFRSGVLEDIGADLNDGFETFVEKREDTEGNGFGDLLACLRDKRIHLDNIHFVTYRNNLNKILGTAYNKSEPWEMGVHKRRGTVYLDVHKLPEGPQSDRQRRLCYWGYSFEQLATTADHVPEANRKEAIVDANVEYCALIKTKLGPHRIIMGAEMDCYDIGRDGRRRYIELKTSRKIEHWTVDKFEKEKLLKFWIQSFLAGVPQIVCAFRDDDGRIMRVDVMGTREITQKVKQKNFWQGGVCLAFADRVLCWLYGTVKENEDYVLKFLPGSNRLELLRAECCPTVISKHVEQLC